METALKPKVLSERSKKNLENVHPDLIRIINRCLSYGTVDFSVIQGQRSIEQHLQNIARGVSKISMSKHCYDPSCAFDFIMYPFTGWTDAAGFDKVAKELVRAAKELGIPARSGGDWNMDGNFRNDRFYDGGHFELILPYRDPKPVIPSIQRGGKK